MAGRSGRREVALAVGLVALGLAACAVPDARPYAGRWKRSAEGGAPLHLTVEKTGTVAIRFDQPPAGTPAEMKGRATFRADTLSFTGASCERGTARYLLGVSASDLTITPLGADGCAVRRSAISGVWTRE